MVGKGLPEEVVFGLRYRSSLGEQVGETVSSRGKKLLKAHRRGEGSGFLLPSLPVLVLSKLQVSQAHFASQTRACLLGEAPLKLKAKRSEGQCMFSGTYLLLEKEEQVPGLPGPC